MDDVIIMKFRQNMENKIVHISSARFKFWGVAGFERFAYATLPTTLLDFQGKVQKIFVTLPS